MTWTKLSDNLNRDPRIVALSDRAFRFYIAGLVYCNDLLTDGVIPAAQARLLAPGWSPRIPAELYRQGLWAPTSSAYVIVDFFETQLSRSAVLALRENRKSAGRRGGIESGRRRTPALSPDEAKAAAIAEAVALMKVQREDDPVPVPVPVPVSRKAYGDSDGVFAFDRKALGVETISLTELRRRVVNEEDR